MTYYEKITLRVIFILKKLKRQLLNILIMDQMFFQANEMILSAQRTQEKNFMQICDDDVKNMGFCNDDIFFRHFLTSDNQSDI